MKKLVCVILSAVLALSLFAGCSTSPPDGSSVEEVPIYSDMPSPRPDVPYFDDYSQPPTPPDNAPEGLLTVAKVQNMYQAMGFTEYQQTSEQGVILYQASSPSSSIVVEEGGAGVVSAVQLTTEAQDPQEACKVIFQFLSIAVGHELPQETRDTIAQGFTSLSQQQPNGTVSNSKDIEIDGMTFVLMVDVSSNTYIINW